MNKNISVIFIFLFFYNWVSSTNYKSQLELRVELEKNEYQKYESIFGELKLINISTENVNIKSLFNLKSENFLSLKCEGNNNREYSGYPLKASIFIEPDYKFVLNPNDSLLITFNLLNCMGEYDAFDLHTFYIPEGIYKISATFCPDAFDLPLNKNEINEKSIISKKINFQIKNGTNKINSPDLNFLVGAIQEKSKIKNHIIFKEKMETFINEFSDSKYIDIAYLKLLLTVRINLKNNEIFYKWLKKAYEKFYNNFFFGEFIIIWIPEKDNIEKDKNKNYIYDIYNDISTRFKDNRCMKYLLYKEYLNHKLNKKDF